MVHKLRTEEILAPVLISNLGAFSSLHKVEESVKPDIEHTISAVSYPPRTSRCNPSSLSAIPRAPIVLEESVSLYSEDCRPIDEYSSESSV